MKQLYHISSFLTLPFLLCEIKILEEVISMVPFISEFLCCIYEIERLMLPKVKLVLGCHSGSTLCFPPWVWAMKSCQFVSCCPSRWSHGSEVSQRETAFLSNVMVPASLRPFSLLGRGIRCESQSLHFSPAPCSEPVLLCPPSPRKKRHLELTPAHQLQSKRPM